MCIGIESASKYCAVSHQGGAETHYYGGATTAIKETYLDDVPATFVSPVGDLLQ